MGVGLKRSPQPCLLARRCETIRRPRLIVRITSWSAALMLSSAKARFGRSSRLPCQREHLRHEKLISADLDIISVLAIIPSSSLEGWNCLPHGPQVGRGELELRQGLWPAEPACCDCNSFKIISCFANLFRGFDVKLDPERVWSIHVALKDP
jgi:hypothetical protein